MKTDELIRVLGRQVEPVRSQSVRNAFLVALIAGSAAAVCVMMASFGIRRPAIGAEHLGANLAGLAFALALTAAGSAFLVRAARPGKPGRGPLLIAGLAFFAVLCGAVAVLAGAGSGTWSATIFGGRWTTCVACIPLFALAPFAAFFLALRHGAPTHLRLTGAIAGLVAGALGAAVCAFYQPADSLPFIALWYAGPIALCAVVGALLGPWLLRW